MSKLNTIQFTNKDNFYTDVITKVKAYFSNRNLSQYANTQTWIKAIIMLSLFFIPYTLMVTGTLKNLFFFYWFVMGMGMVGIGAAVMHDANHGAFSKSKKINNLVGHVIEVIGGYALTWKIQHNTLHHTYTNIEGLDGDINASGILRFSPNDKRKWFHKYQYIYAPFFYMLLTLNWMTIKDFYQIISFKNKGLLKTSLTKELAKIAFFKTIYYTYIMALPIIYSGLPWYYTIYGFLIMHATSGLTLSLIFQPAHVMGEAKFSNPVDGKIEDSWAVHEMKNTINFAPKNKFLTWFIGGLNFQIEHHLFTNISHIHYSKISKIVKQTAKEHNIPYYEQPSFTRAILVHFSMLKKLGRQG